MQRGAGVAAAFTDEAYVQAGASLLDDADVALRVAFCGSGESLSATLVHKVLRYITQDCDRAVSSVVVSPDLGRHLLSETFHRPVEWATATEPLLLAASTPVGTPPALALADEIPLDDLFADEAAEPADPILGEQVGLFILGDAADPTALPAEGACVAEEAPTEAIPDPSEAEVPVALVEADDNPARARPWGDTPDGDRRVLALRRTLRSGAVVRFPGDVVLFGDLNAGAQIVAHGDIVVLGKLRGLAHAGSRGDTAALVIGLDMTAGQVRIADVIAFPQEEPETPAAGSRLTRLLAKVQPSLPRPVAPTIARLVDGTIRIEDYRGRLHA